MPPLYRVGEAEDQPVPEPVQGSLAVGFGGGRGWRAHRRFIQRRPREGRNDSAARRHANTIGIGSRSPALRPEGERRRRVERRLTADLWPTPGHDALDNLRREIRVDTDEEQVTLGVYHPRDGDRPPPAVCAGGAVPQGTSPAHIRRRRTGFLFLQYPDDPLIAEPAALHSSVLRWSGLYRKMAPFQGSTSLLMPTVERGEQKVMIHGGE